VPNNKFSWNRPQLIGLQTDYVEGDWKTRQRIMDEHWEMTQGLLYFLQHDPTVPKPVRDGWLQIGLAKDEYFGTRGFFPTYDARTDDPLTKPVGRLWAKMFAELVGGKLDPLVAARTLHGLADSAIDAVPTSGYTELLKAELTRLDQDSSNVERIARRLNFNRDDTLTRAKACQWMYQLLTTR
jgi:hypothetical protein